MILKDYKAIFVHINKTGGSSIEQALCGSYHITTKHYNVYDYARHTPYEFANYFKVTFVRNPWDKVVSQYFFQLMHKGTDKAFKDFIRKPSGRPFINQLDWITINGHIAVNCIGRFETLEEDFDEICQHIGIKTPALPRINKTVHEHYSIYYDDEDREFVGNIFYKDIQFFGYRFENK